MFPEVWRESAPPVHRKDAVWLQTRRLLMLVRGDQLWCEVAADLRPDFDHIVGIPVPEPYRMSMASEQMVTTTLFRSCIDLMSGLDGSPTRTRYNSVTSEYEHDPRDGMLGRFEFMANSVRLAIQTAERSDPVTNATIAWSLLYCLILPHAVQPEPGKHRWVRDLLPELFSHVMAQLDEEREAEAAGILES